MTFLDLLDQEIATQLRELEFTPAYVKLQALRTTRSLYVGEAVDLHVVSDVEKKNVRHGTPVRHQNAPAMAGKSLDAVNAAIEILRSHGAPLRTAELLPRIEERGIVFSGSARQNILSSLLSRSLEVVSKGGRIGWALASWDSTGGDSVEGSSPPVDLHPVSAPVEPGEEVVHDKIS